MFRVPKTTERFSFDDLGSTSSFLTWLFHTWNTLDVNEEGNKVHHTGVRIVGCRYDTWEVTPNALAQGAGGGLIAGGSLERRVRWHWLKNGDSR